MAQPARSLANDAYERIDVRPVAGSLGAEIGNVDVNHLADQAFDEIYRAFVEHQVIMLRDQTLTPDAYLAFARRWGEIKTTPYMKGLPSHPEILEILKTETDTYAFGNGWHSDGIFSPIPPKATMLYALEVPPAGGDTLFTNMYAAYDTLSDGMKALLGGVKALNLGETKVSRYAELSKMQRREPVDEQVDTVHPLVRTHPDTGRKSLFLSSHTRVLDGMTEAESAPLIAFLRNHAIRPEFTCRLRWRPGSMAIWDNRCTLHYAIDDYAGHRRRMHRITIKGEEAPY